MIKLNGKKRNDTEKGKKFTKQLRKNGQLPAVIIGGAKDSIAIEINTIEYAKIIENSDYHRNQLITIVFDDQTEENVITRQVDRNRMNNQLIHVDFIRISDDQKVEIEIPVVAVGQAKGQKLGGVLVQPISKLKVKVYHKIFHME